MAPRSKKVDSNDLLFLEKSQIAFDPFIRSFDTTKERRFISFAGVWTHDLPHPRSREFDALDRLATVGRQWFKIFKKHIYNTVLFRSLETPLNHVLLTFIGLRNYVDFKSLFRFTATKLLQIIATSLRNANWLILTSTNFTWKLLNKNNCALNSA